MEINSTEKVVYWIGLMSGGLFGGIMCGLLPYLVGIKRKQCTLAIIALILSSITGLMLGFIYALIVSLIGTVMIVLGKGAKGDG